MNYLKYEFPDRIGTTNVIVAEDAKSTIHCRYDNDEEEVYLSCLGVQEEARKCGRAKDIMRVAEEWAIGYGAHSVRLDSPHDMVELFEKLGYQENYSDYISVFMEKKLGK